MHCWQDKIEALDVAAVEVALESLDNEVVVIVESLASGPE